MSTTGPTFEDCLPLTRLYARFDAIAEGLAPGDSSAVHRAVLRRLAANQRTAEGLGWTACALERLGGSGRLLLYGVRSTGLPREVVPDWIPGSPEASKRRMIGPVERSPNDDKRERYRHVEILMRERLLAASPALPPDAFERLARRLVAAAYKHDASSASDPAPGTSGSDRAPRGTESGDDARWLDDGGAAM